jgi:MFS family permease
MLVGSGVFILLALAAFYLTRDRQQKNVIDQHHTSRSTRHTVLAVLKQFNLWKVYIFALCLYAPIPVLATLWIDPFLMTEFHRSAAETLFSGSLIFVGALFGAPIIGAIASQTGHVKRVALSFSTLSFICCIITLYVPMNMDLIDVALFLLGFGTASATLASSLAASIATREQTPIALSFVITSLNASGAVLLPFIGFMIDLLWHAHHNTPEYSSYNLHVGLMVLPILMLVGLLVGATITAPKPD